MIYYYLMVGEDCTGFKKLKKMPLEIYPSASDFYIKNQDEESLHFDLWYAR